MANFNLLSKNLSDTMIELVSSQNLCKLLYYPTFDPLSEQDIEDPSVLLFNKIYPHPHIPEVTKQTTSIINVVLDAFTLGGTDFVKEGVLTFIILVHSDLWRISGGLRPFSIMSEIDKIFNDNRVIGLKKLRFEQANFTWNNDKFSGYKVSYKMVSANR